MSSEQLNLEVVEIVRNWNDLAKRGHYERRLQELGPTAVETLLILMQQEVETRKRRKRMGLFLIVLPFGLTLLKVSLFGKNPGFTIEVFFSAIRFLCFYRGFYCLFTSSSQAASILADFNDIRAVGPLVESWREAEKKPALADALIRLLPQMKASHASLLSAEQRKALYKILRSREETLVLAILKALEQIGDSSALPYVERLLDSFDETEVSKRVQKAARECLPFLIEMARQERDSATLLRAAEGTGHNAGELLRPVSADTETNSRDLLHATQQD